MRVGDFLKNKTIIDYLGKGSSRRLRLFFTTLNNTEYIISYGKIFAKGGWEEVDSFTAALLLYMGCVDPEQKNFKAARDRMTNLIADIPSDQYDYFFLGKKESEVEGISIAWGDGSPKKKAVTYIDYFGSILLSDNVDGNLLLKNLKEIRFSNFTGKVKIIFKDNKEINFIDATDHSDKNPFFNTDAKIFDNILDKSTIVDPLFLSKMRTIIHT
jgi:hypothetical protein